MKTLAKLPTVENCAFCEKPVMSDRSFRMQGDSDYYCSLSCLMTDYGFEMQDGETLPDNRALQSLKIKEG